MSPGTPARVLAGHGACTWAQMCACACPDWPQGSCRCCACFVVHALWSLGMMRRGVPNPGAQVMSDSSTQVLLMTKCPGVLVPKGHPLPRAAGFELLSAIIALCAATIWQSRGTLALKIDSSSLFQSTTCATSAV
eukprot:scaffold123439_cov22-Tisochrysis_lutea.AAC.1